MTPETRTEIVAALEESRRIFIDALTGVSDEDASRVPAYGGWSVLNIVDHLQFTESNLPRFVSMATRQEGALRDSERETTLTSAVHNRASRIEAPARVHPTGRFKTVAEASAAFDATRSATVRFATEHEQELDCMFTSHPMFGPVSLRQLLVLAAGHSTRHAAQIRETLRDLRA